MLFVFRHFWTPCFVKGHILRRDMPAFSSSSTPGMYNEADWKQFYRLNIDGIGGAGGTAQGADGLGYGCTPGINQYGTKGDWYAIAIINNGQGTNGYAINNGNHGTPSDTIPNYNNPLEDFHWISNYGGPYTGCGSTWVIGVTPLIHTDSTHLNQDPLPSYTKMVIIKLIKLKPIIIMVITPDKYLHVGELESSHYHWNHSVGQGGYGGVTWDNRGVSTPVINYHSINIDHRSVANILDNGNAYASQIETNYNHGVTPAAHGWIYQGMSAGMSHISIIFDWGGGSYSNQNASHPNGANSRSCSQI